MKRILSATIITGICTLTSGTLVHASAKRFIPRYADYSGEIVLQGSFSGRQTDSGKRSNSSREFALQEFFHAKGIGFIYRPSFISMTTDVSLGLQQQFNETNTRSYDKNSNVWGFRQDLTLLPSHPYNLYLYIGRSQELVEGGYGVGQSSSIVLWEYGAQARYEKRPWQSSISYSHNESESVWNSVTDTYAANLYYFNTLDLINVNTSYHHFDSSRYAGLNTTNKDVFALHFRKRWDNFRFVSRGDLDQHEQEDNYLFTENSPTYWEHRQRWEWYTEGAAYLPYNVDSKLSYRKTNNEQSSRRGGYANSTENNTDSYNLKFTHRLFKSVVTILNGSYRISESLNAKTEQQNIRLGSSYTKRTRLGNIAAGLSGGISDTTSAGSQTTLSEEYRLSPSSPTSFTLGSQLVDPETVSISVIDHTENGILVSLIRNVHFLVVNVGQSYRVVIIGLPVQLANPWLEYTYLADYATLGSEYTLRGTTFGGHLRTLLLDGLITPHTSYRQYKQDVVNGYFPGDPNSGNSYSLGLTFAYGSINGDVTQSWVESEVESQERFNAWITYDTQIQQYTGGSCSLAYENRNIEDLQSRFSTGESQLEEDIYSLNAQIYNYWPDWKLNTNLSGNYSLYQGLGQTTTRGLLFNTTWNIGRMDLSLRLNYSDTESDMSGNKTNTGYSTVWFLLRRKLF
ncbi:MAG: hypothetical protein K9K37_07150 [Desulfocapsa sp.]|nr:hypothetical protein [Desulfocapsa sp.]